MDSQYEIPPTLKSLPEREIWVQLVSGFQPTDAFVARATAQVENIKMVSESNERSSAAALWIDRIAYPLTIFAMVVVVLAFGHLLSNKPYVETSSEDAAITSETRRAVTRSLLIVGLLSIVDLIWTMAAAQTSSLRELNPLGSQLIDNPLQLVVFKTTVTAIAIGLLYRLHRLPIAQLGSWWSCLVLTLLTARWLTFHSMFL